ncbi:MAG: AAA family ATPase [Anaerolineae bacterium]|jgi:putative ATP-dependent endonuclease of the OLD family|nr:AAA family ATPase [Anaerolineae bacterium]
MLLQSARIYNYRNFTDIEVPFVSFSALVGPNNIGKSSILQALEYIFTTAHPRNVPITKADFHDPSKKIIVEAVLGDLNDDDKDAFFHDDGLVNLAKNTITIRFVSSWSSFDQDVESECYFVRDDLPEDQQRITDFSNRYKPFVPLFVISSERSASQEVGISKRQDLGRILRMYSSDYLKPLPTLHSEIHQTFNEIEDEKDNWDKFPHTIFEQIKPILNEVLSTITPDFAQIIVDKDPNDIDDLLDGLEKEWDSKEAGLQEFIDKNPDVPFRKTILQVLERVPILIKRAKTQNSLYELQRGMLQERKFEEMNLGMKDVFDKLLPKQGMDINLFSVQDDELISQMSVNLDNHSVLNTGSGFQSMFVIGLKLVRMLAQLQASSEQVIRTFIVGVEEPENYLHPHMQRHIVNFFRNLQKLWAERGYHLQIVITTHSPSILNRFGISELVLLKEKKNIVDVSRWHEKSLEELATSLQPDETKRGKLVSQIQLQLDFFLTLYADSFFSSFVIIVEGETEEGAIPEWAKSSKLEFDFDLYGISVIRFQNMRLGSMILKEFKIAHVIVADGGDNHNFTNIPEDLLFLSDKKAFEKTVVDAANAQTLLKALIAKDSIERNQKRAIDIAGKINEFKGVKTLEEILELLNGESISDTSMHIFSKELVKWLAASKGIMLGKLIAQNTTAEEIPPYITNMFSHLNEFFETIKADA